MEQFKKALMTLHEKDKEITIRMMFGSILGAPVDCTTVLADLTADIPADSTKLKLWVGAWRKGVSWNHSKIIAVDGRYLHTGGHNLYDSHYLQYNPISDLSLEMQGRYVYHVPLFCCCFVLFWVVC
jgi:phosphatidylserine/phosphatidylglycerophosphate/cardiolipin synthase-like enzyme